VQKRNCAKPRRLGQSCFITSMHRRTDPATAMHA